MKAPDRETRQWAAKKIGELLQMPPDNCEEIVENILAYDDADELKDFLSAFADSTASFKISAFVAELFERRAPPAPPPREEQRSAPQKGGGGRGDGRGRGKGRNDEEDARGRGGRRGGGEEVGQFPKLLMPMRPKDKADKRLIVIDAASGRHKILTNCLNCGKVIAEEEGWGPCLFCGNPLEATDGFGARHGDDRGMMGIEQRPAPEKFQESYEKAVETKDRLLNYDRDAAKRTKVYDDATDWYSESVNPWLNERQREEALNKGKEEERRQREGRRRVHAKIDLFGRTVIDASAEFEDEQKQKDKEKFQNFTEDVSEQNKLMSFLEAERAGGKNQQLSQDSQQLYEKLRASLHGAARGLHTGPTSDGSCGPEARGGDEVTQNWKPRWGGNEAGRVEDEFCTAGEDFARAAASGGRRALLPAEESPYGDACDSGQCLSMHQPWASLLIHGFKRAEGRGWKAEHRGRLWIHAAAKPPDDSEVKTLEQRYRSLYEKHGVPTPPLPSELGGYPTSALLGCVDIEACWSQDEYKAVLAENPSMPQEENDCEYVFWCLCPRKLVVPLKMGGDHKIWRLNRQSVQPAQRGLQPVRWPVPDVAGGERSLVDVSPAIAPAVGGTAVASDNLDDDDGVEESERLEGSASLGSAAASGDASAKAKATRAAAAGRRQAPPLLDLWPKEAPVERLEVLTRDTSGKADREVVVLQDGFVHLVGFVPPDIQQRVIDEIREVGVSPAGFFDEQPAFNEAKVSTNVTRMYLGSHWNVVAQRWEPVRGNLDGANVAELPPFLVDMYDEAIRRANRELTTAKHKKRKLAPFVGPVRPGLGVVDFYQSSGSSMQMHQDRTESQESITAGYAVMCMCIGDACDLAYGNEEPSGKQKPKTVRLESGDVFLFGGASRLLWHGVPKVHPRTGPPSLRLLPGRLSVTLRAR